MPWWSWRPGPADGGDPETRSGITVESAVRVGPPSPRQPGDDCPGSDRPVLTEIPATIEPVSLRRVCDALDLLDVRYLADGDGNLLAMWERHAVLATVPPDWADRAYRVVNEWNHTRRFCKAYIGDPTERGQLPIYAELQVPLGAGTHDALLVEMLDCGAAVALSFVDWLHDEGALL
jgi:hypothetical protein